MQKFFILVIFLLVYISSKKVVVEAALPFKNQCVKWHNVFRTKHQVGPVTWNDAIAKGAEKWAKYLAANNMFKHESNIKEGENLYMLSHKPTEPCTAATKAFYGEVKYYDFDKPGYSKKTGHFTQVVWKNTKQIGAAQATRKDGHFIVVIRYSPPGNYLGEKPFSNNVFPPKGGEAGSPPSPRGGGPRHMCCSLGSKALVIITATVIAIKFYFI